MEFKPALPQGIASAVTSATSEEEVITTTSKKAPEDQTEIQIKVLLHEHSMMRAEALLMLSHYKNNVRVLQLSVTGILALMYWVAITPTDDIPKNPFNWFLGFGIVTMIPLVTGCMVMDILHTLYTQILLGSRFATIENQVTRLGGPNLMIWEKIAKEFFSAPRPGGNVYNPAWFHATLAGLVVLVLMLLVPACAYVFWLIPLAAESGVDFPELPVILGAAFTAAVVYGCLFFAVEVLHQMRQKSDIFVANLMAQQSFSPEDGTG